MPSVEFEGRGPARVVTLNGSETAYLTDSPMALALGADRQAMHLLKPALSSRCPKSADEQLGSRTSGTPDCGWSHLSVLLTSEQHTMPSALTGTSLHQTPQSERIRAFLTRNLTRR